VMVWDLPDKDERTVEAALTALRESIPEEIKNKVRGVTAFRSRAGKMLATYTCAPDAAIDLVIYELDRAQPSGGTVVGGVAKYLRFSVASERGDMRPRNVTQAAKEVLEDSIVGHHVIVRGTRIYLKKAGDETAPELVVGGYDVPSDKWCWRLGRLQQLVPSIRAEDIEVFA